MSKPQLPRFDPKLLDDIRERTPLPELIGRTVELKRSGNGLIGCCPFHGERTPSFHVYAKHFHCYGCAAHGDAIDFVSKKDQVSFPEAVRRLASEAGLEIPGQNPKPATPEERAKQEEAAAERQRRIEARAIVDAQEREKNEAAIAKRAEAVWGKASPAPADHPYLVRKEIEPHDLRVDRHGQLLVPMRDDAGKLWNLQTIAADGAKSTLWRRVPEGTRGGRVKGLSYHLGEVKGGEPAVVVSEGFATGASIHKESGLPVVVAFSGNNLQPTVQSLRASRPELPIIVGADNDHQKERLTPPKENTGLAKALAAIKDVPNAVVVAPSFAVDDPGKDWNDYISKHPGEDLRTRFLVRLRAAALAAPTPNLEQQVNDSPTTTPAANPGPAANIPDLVAALDRQAKGDPRAEAFVGALVKDLRENPHVENEQEFRNRVALAVTAFEAKGQPLAIADELRSQIVTRSQAPEASHPAHATVPPEPPPPSPPAVDPAEAPPRPASAYPSAQTRPPASPQSPPQPGQPPAQPQAQPQTIQAPVRPAGPFTAAMATIYNALRAPSSSTSPQWEQPPRPLGERLNAYEQRRADLATQNLTQTASDLGEKARQALEALGKGPGSAVLNQIKLAAQNDPGGYPEVLSQMRPGGKYADLRSAFDSTLVQERAFSTAYERAVDGISRYGQARVHLNDSLAARQVDPAGMDRQFETMDKEIAQAAETAPGRAPGKTVHDELAEKAKRVAEFLRSVVERVKAAVTPNAPAQAPTPSPAASAAPALVP